MIGRRSLVSGIAGTAAGLGVAAPPRPTSAQELPELHWRMVSNFPKSLDTLYGTAIEFTKAVAELSQGRFRIDVFAAGEIVPGLQVLDAVQNGTVEMGHGPTYFYSGKDPTFTLFTCLPFGLNARMQNAWLYQGGGIDLLNEFLAKFNAHALPGGNSGCQMGGWFRKEINSLSDLKGLKFRIPGMAGQIWQRMGAVPQQIAPGDIYPALERGTIDAAEFVGPYDDEKLSLYKVAKYYYYPGWWEGGPLCCTLANLEKWQSLPEYYRQVIAYASAYANGWMTATYDAYNPAALKRLVAAGAVLRPFPQDVMQAAWEEANKLYAEICGTNADFKKVYDHMIAFRNDQYLWWQVAEFSYDAFMVRQRRA
jgi:TRAP-type mannitol/chloroaromatic compound transport system substrate-binding protein